MAQRQSFFQRLHPRQKLFRRIRIVGSCSHGERAPSASCSRLSRAPCAKTSWRETGPRRARTAPAATASWREKRLALASRPAGRLKTAGSRATAGRWNSKSWSRTASRSVSRFIMRTFAAPDRRGGARCGWSMKPSIQRRRQKFDFDMIIGLWQASASPGNEQRMRWGGDSADQEASYNLAGARSPAIDAMIAALQAARGARGIRHRRPGPRSCAAVRLLCGSALPFPCAVDRVLAADRASGRFAPLRTTLVW